MFKKIVRVLVLVVTIFFGFYISQAADGGGFPDVTKFESVENAKIEKASTNVFGSIIDIVQVVCVGLAIIMLIVQAIKYMVASPDGKAELKKDITMYTIGAVIVFAAFALVEIIQNFVKGNFKEAQ